MNELEDGLIAPKFRTYFETDKYNIGLTIKADNNILFRKNKKLTNLRNDVIIYARGDQYETN